MRKKQPTEVEKMMDLATAQVLCEYGKFKSIVEALDWMEDWRRKKNATSRREEILSLQKKWEAMIPPGSDLEDEIQKRLKKAVKYPAEIKRLQKELKQTRKELAEVKRERAGKKGIPPNFQALKQLELFPVDPNAYDLIPWIIPDGLSKNELIYSEDLPDESRILKYRKVYQSHRVTYTWIIPAEIKDGIPTVGRLARKVAFATYGFYFQQKTNGPEIKPAEMLSLLGVGEKQLSAGGGKYQYLVNIYRTLAYGTYELESWVREKWKIDKVGHFFSEVDFSPGKKKINIIKPYFSPYAIETLHKFLQDQPGGRYIAYNQKLLRAPISREAEKFLRQLGIYRNLQRPVSVNALRKIFSQPKWLGFTKSRLESLRPKKINEILMDILTTAKEEGIIDRWEFDYKGNPDSRKKAVILSWGLKIYMAQGVRKKNLQEIGIPRTAETKDLADKITTWLTRSIFKTRTSEDEVHKQVINTIEKYGAPAIGKIFRGINFWGEAHPKRFWNDVKKLKKDTRDSKASRSG